MMEGTAREKTREEEPGVSKNYGATQSCRSILDSGGCLNYDILRIIFEYLNARDLGSAAMVCRSWSEAANNEKSIRGPCCFNSYTERDFLYKMKNIRIKPSIGFFFISKDVPLRIIDHIEDSLPEHCEAIMLATDSIDSDFEIDEFESSNDEIDSQILNVGCAFLPQIPNVRIELLELIQDWEDWDDFIIQKSREYQEIIETIVDHETSISNTCFMLFCNCDGQPTAKHLASAMQESKEVKIASVCGVMVDEIYALQQRKKKFQKMDALFCVAVLITGSMETWSTILYRECSTMEQIEARLKLFKDKVKLKKHSIGFMFACSDRGIEIMESMIFKRLFPEVPLSVLKAMYSGYYIAENDEEEYKCKKSEQSWYSGDSTVFLILTYG